MTENWLHTYLRESVRGKLCTRIHCTTCGALEFRRGVLRALASAMGATPATGMDPASAVQVARALAELEPDASDATRLEEAARCLLFDLCRTIGEAEAGRLLGQSWGADVLRCMQEHHRAVLAARAAREAYEGPEAAQKRRDEKKRLAQERHQQRLLLKQERNRTRRETHGQVD